MSAKCCSPRHHVVLRLRELSKLDLNSNCTDSQTHPRPLCSVLFLFLQKTYCSHHTFQYFRNIAEDLVVTGQHHVSWQVTSWRWALEPSFLGPNPASYFRLYCCLVLVVSLSFETRGLEPIRLSFHGVFRQESQSRFPAPEIFPTQKSNPCLINLSQILYCQNHQRSPILYQSYVIGQGRFSAHQFFLFFPLSVKHVAHSSVPNKYSLLYYSTSSSLSERKKMSLSQKE